MASKTIRPKRSANLAALNDKQRLFVVAYFSDNAMNATNAAQAAGYACPGAAAGKLIANPAIQRAIGVELRKRLANGEITAARVLRELAYIGFCDPIEMFDEEGMLREVRAMPESMRRNIASFEIKSVKVIGGKTKDSPAVCQTILKIKLWPKTNALELIAKHLGMLDERFKVEHGVDPASRAVLKSLLERLEQAPSPIIDSNYIEHQAANTIDGKVITRPDSGDDGADDNEAIE